MSNNDVDIKAVTLKQLESLIDEIRSLNSDPMQAMVNKYFLVQIARLLLTAIAASASLAAIYFGLADYFPYAEFVAAAFAVGALGVVIILIMAVGDEHYRRSEFDKNKLMISVWVRKLWELDEKLSGANKRINDLERQLHESPPETISAQQAEIEELSQKLIAKEKTHEQVESEKASLESALEELRTQLGRASTRLESLEQEQKSQDVKNSADIRLDALSEVLVQRLSSLAPQEQPSNEAIRPISAIIEALNALGESQPDLLKDAKSLAFVSEEEKRISQYETILQLYNQKIGKLRAQDMDEEDREEAIQAMKRLRDREIELLANAEVVNG